MKIIKEYSGLVALVAIVLASLFGNGISFGSSANGGNVTNYDAVSVLDGYYINDVAALNGTLSNLLGLLTVKPAVIATTTGGVASTLSQAELAAAQYQTININANADYTFTLPASSTLTTLLPNTGNNGTWCFANATTSSQIDLIFVAGTGIDLEMATTSGNAEAIGPSDSGCLTLQRKANTDLFGRFDSYDDSD